jgi:hypothetical protein
LDNCCNFGRQIGAIWHRSESETVDSRSHLKLGDKSKTETFSTKEEAIIWEQGQRLALKGGDPTLNPPKDKFVDIAAAY